MLRSVEDLRQAGNSLFAAGLWGDAAAHYAKTIKLCERQNNLKAASICLSNRSTALIKLGRPQRALEDARKAIKYDPTYSKAHFRESKCCLGRLPFTS
jgi:tetratricopeptide (TPR) repeat protein